MLIDHPLVEVYLEHEEDFLRVKETLSRIGIASKKNKKLYQTCHILHKQGRYYIVHFLEMFILDGRGKNFTDDDLGRRNTIANLLEQWNLLKIVDHSITESPLASMKTIMVLPYAEKGDWELIEKYSLGKFRTKK